MLRIFRCVYLPSTPFIITLPNSSLGRFGSDLNLDKHLLFRHFYWKHFCNYWDSFSLYLCIDKCYYCKLLVVSSFLWMEFSLIYRNFFPTSFTVFVFHVFRFSNAQLCSHSSFIFTYTSTIFSFLTFSDLIYLRRWYDSTLHLRLMFSCIVKPPEHSSPSSGDKYICTLTSKLSWLEELAYIHSHPKYERSHLCSSRWLEHQILAGKTRCAFSSWRHLSLRNHL
mgnify:CR=1 FL=1